MIRVDTIDKYAKKAIAENVDSKNLKSFCNQRKKTKQVSLSSKELEEFVYYVQIRIDFIKRNNNNEK
jgi:hypothetical protein